MSNYFILMLVLVVYMLCWYGASIILKRNDVADIAWGLGFVLMAWLSFFTSDFSLKALVVNILVTVWGLRLSWHIFNRNRNKPEDFRYLQWRKEWKYFYLRSFFQVFMLQGLFLFIIALPVVYINTQAVVFHWVDTVGILVWLAGFYFEAIGDYQLKQFRLNLDNRGKIITTGLWRYSRHPNYFGEALQWWGIFLMALMMPLGWLMIVSPLTITYLLRYVSGVPTLERKYAGHKAFEDYKSKTSAFIPMKPKR
ncbi:MAG: DUF1295 domain-containing protein [Cyclobacteriaceae bacterium]|nr:DUF1295 domain-containing protein [Cyclobacteriaceae bacterium]